MAAVATCVASVVMVAAAGAMAVPVEIECGSKMPSACDKAIDNGTMPSASCCSILKEQEECLCMYLDRLKRSDKVSNGYQTIASCGISNPICII
jgi:hypothetical protein